MYKIKRLFTYIRVFLETVIAENFGYKQGVLQLTELLRHKQPGDYRALYEKALENIAALKALTA